MSDTWGQPPSSGGGSGGWGQAPYGVGRRFRNRAHAYGTEGARRWLDAAGREYASTGCGVLVVGDMSRALPGSFPPHVSHRDGRDLDVAYTASYPSNEAEPVCAALVAALASPAVEVVFTSAARKQELEALAAASGVKIAPVVQWPGHTKHAHVRVREEE